MKDLELFEKFGKKNKSGLKELTNNCVVYTRVSSKDQRDNFSLPLQLKVCNEYIERHELNVLSYFGGDYESAKTDERKEFNRMLTFIRRSKEKVSYIIVYKLDRFSRTGPNAIYLKDQLQQQGIHILSVQEPSDPTTISGTFQQDIQLVVSKFDNAQRRERTISGMRERLLAGYWCGPAPAGYDCFNKGKQQQIVVNEEGRILRKAFEWKGYEGLANTEIVAKLRIMGLKVSKQRLTDMFRNPFYCGLISHNILNGQVVEGKHEKLISKELFLLVNQVQSTVPQGWKVEFENDNIPLKRYLKCDDCGKNMRGYIVKRKNIYYYKCGTIGCCCNVNAKKIHEAFLQLLKPFTLTEKYIPLVKFQIQKTFEEINQGQFDNIKIYKGKLTEIEQKIERLEERFVEEEVSKELYDKYQIKYKEEKKEILELLETSQSKTSNLDSCIETAIAIASKLDMLWKNSDYNMKQKLQNLIFPDGIYYNKENGQCRTSRVNLIFEIIGCITKNLEQKKSGQIHDEHDLSGLVARRGIESIGH